MRPAVILMAVMGVALLLASGVALAATIKCHGGLCRGTSGHDRMTGTAGFDKMYGLSRSDSMYGQGRGDSMYGGGGADIMVGGTGGDRMYGGVGQDQIDAETGKDYVDAADGYPDSISCGPNEDRAVVDLMDRDAAPTLDAFVRATSCENVDTVVVP